MRVTNPFQLPLTLISLLLAMGLRILLLPYPLSVLNPDWVALLLLFWAMASRGGLGVVSAWVTGLMVDTLTGSHLGQHALSYGVLVYLSVRWGQRLLFYPMPQQIVTLLVLLLINQLLLLWTQDAHLEGMAQTYYWLSALSGALLWPFVTLLDHAGPGRVKNA